MNRKATFAKRQRESDLKDHARSKEARKAARKDTSRTGKGPEIAWDEAVYPTASVEGDNTVSTNPTDDNADSAPEPQRPAPSAPSAPAPASSPPPSNDDNP